jgi:hypothetical protein
MAYTHDVNNVGGADGGAEVMFNLKALLVSVGWTVESSGDGLALYGHAGALPKDRILIPGAGATGMNNQRAWFRIKGPAGMTPAREFIFQRGSGTQVNWWIRVSPEDGFTGGAPDFQTIPTATDAVSPIGDILGSSTAGAALFGAAATYKWHMGADAAAPYAWWLLALANGTGAVSGVVLFEPMSSGSYPVEDDDPALYYAAQGATMLSVTQLTSSVTSPFGWFKKDLAGEGWIRHAAHSYYTGAGIIIPGGVGTNPYTGEDNHFPIPWGRGPWGGASIGWKGFGSQLRWSGFTRSNGDTLSTGGAKDKLCVDNVVLPWPDVIPII